ncbi:LysR family transcriptional regulator [Entomomonas sp. E2T0]|uniref:LysR family transcriptional regulator n=1 Tax=Entomomonas sp. E2T0 TaxID=2930213 RepID=UPI00222841D2|nr:LysR family transcriptional regulator [Entomomonas sp. E2T0]UYZ83931.1 LysR family transcriptional regulator [Entomomonas sp. E2T0]
MKKELPLDLKQLKYFIHVAEFGSFTKAANHLDIAQSMLSRQIRRLEVDLRQNLLVRNGRGVTLTDNGKILLEHAYGIMHQIERTYEELTSGQLTGKVTIGLPPTMAKLLAVPITKQFKQALPKANLIIIEALTSTIEEGILTGKIDIGLLHSSTLAADLEVAPLGDEDLCLIAPLDDNGIKQQIFTLEEVAKLPLILPSHPNSYRSLVETEMAKIGCKPDIVLEMNSVNTILELVYEKMGYAILSARTLELVTYKDALVAYPITSPTLMNKLFIAVSNKRIMTQTQKTMKSIIEQLCQAKY